MSVAFVNSEFEIRTGTWYILPLTNGAVCLSANNCIILSHFSENNLRKASEKALTVTDSTIKAVDNKFESFQSAIYLLRSSAYVAHCSFMIGGALCMVNCRNITIVHSTFTCYSDNTWRSCTNEVLKVYSTDSELLLTNCTFKERAIIVESSNVKILNSYFSENFAQCGAAIQANDGSVATIIDTHFCYNEVDLDYYKLYVYTLPVPGGAISCRRCKMEIIRGVFEHNTGAACIAWVSLRTDYALAVLCQFSHNTAAELGGGIYATVLTNIEISGTTLFENNIQGLIDPSP